jgi:hypothetical protein
LLDKAQRLLQSEKGNKEEALDSDLLLGYGLALSSLSDKKKALEGAVAKLRDYEEKTAGAELLTTEYAKKLKGDKMNDPKLTTEYRKTIEDMEESMRRVEELTRLVQMHKREIAVLEMELLPLTKEVELIYGTSKAKAGAEEPKPTEEGQKQ